jgi:hypothetical protein
MALAWTSHVPSFKESVVSAACDRELDARVNVEIASPALPEQSTCVAPLFSLFNTGEEDSEPELCMMIKILFVIPTAIIIRYTNYTVNYK